MVIGEVPGSTGPNDPGIRAVSAQPKQRFALKSASASSIILEYPGEMLLVEATEQGTVLDLQMREEDTIKLDLSRHGIECKTTCQRQGSSCWRSCIASNMQAAEIVVMNWFTSLWGSEEHWQLCNRQQKSPPIEQRQIHLTDRTVRADVIRQDPLVMVGSPLMLSLRSLNALFALPQCSLCALNALFLCTLAPSSLHHFRSLYITPKAEMLQQSPDWLSLMVTHWWQSTLGHCRVLDKLYTLCDGLCVCTLDVLSVTSLCVLLLCHLCTISVCIRSLSLPRADSHPRAD